MTYSLDAHLPLALSAFDSADVNNPDDGDRIFSEHGCGNVQNGVSQPFERMLAYEHLLDALKKRDPDKYLLLHKGLAYHYLAWLAYQIESYSTALHYLDNAISEDIRSFGDAWVIKPAARFLSLQPDPALVTNAIIQATRSALATAVSGYHDRHGGEFSVDDLAQLLFSFLASSPHRRSIVCGIYIFALEFARRQRELDLRCIDGGSIAPFVGFLFRGCVCVESLLKIHIPSHRTLGAILQSPEFETAFGFKVLGISADSLAQALATCMAPTIRDKIRGAGQLRNTLGHNLAWDDVFSSPSSLGDAYRTIMDAIIHITVTLVPAPTAGRPQ